MVWPLVKEMHSGNLFIFLLMKLFHFLGRSIKTCKCLPSLENQSNNTFVIFLTELFILSKVKTMNITRCDIVCWSWTQINEAHTPP